MKPLRLAHGWARLVGGFARELATSTVDVIAAVLGDRSRLKPAIIAVPLDVRSDAGKTLFADMVTLTPGTTSLEVSEDKRTLYVHALDVEDPEATKAELKATLERSVGRVLP